MFNISDINWPAFIVCSISAMIIGFLWYGPLFGKAWKKANRFTDKDMKNMKITPAAAMVYGTINALVTAFFVGLITAALKSGNLSGGLIAGFVLWIGIAATSRMNSVIYEQKPLSLFIVNAGYDLANILVMCVIFSVWK